MVDSIGKSALPSAVQAVEKARAHAGAKRASGDEQASSFSTAVDQISLSVEAVDLVDADAKANKQALDVKSTLQDDEAVTLAPSNENFDDFLK